MRVALVHDWLTGMRGGEKCLEVFCELFPEADLFTLLHVPGSVSPAIERRRIVTSAIDRLPLPRRTYRFCLPLMPAAVESLDLDGYDLVLSSSHCVAKGAIAPPGALHLSSVHTPMRYAWDLRALYFPPQRWTSRWLVPPLLARLRQWDVQSASRVDRFVANSRFVAARIARYYGRDAEVIHPPVDTRFFAPDPTSASRGDDGFYLVVGALVPYKGVEIAVEAFNRLGRPLRVVGTGALRSRLEARAGSNVRFTGWLSDADLREHYARCRALVFPSIEDFGIVPLEANAMGRPVIALARGGALETVAPANDPRNPLLPAPANARRAPTGVLFPERTAESLAAAVRFFERHEGLFDPAALRRHALPYDRARFKRQIGESVARALSGRGSNSLTALDIGEIRS